MENLNIVIVANNFDMLDRCVQSNIFMNKYKIHVFDNRTNVKGISEHYNDYIQNIMAEDQWILFCHQDFSLLEDFDVKLKKLDKNCIYGVVGAAPVNEMYFYMFARGYSFFKFKIGLMKKRKQFGRILQGKGNKCIKKGIFVLNQKVVDTVDCCCTFIHSSLIKKNNLLFDPMFKWHFYSEDFSLNAHKLYNIKSKVIQTKCCHYSLGNFNQEFYDNLEKLKAKYHERTFVTTCYDGYYESFKNKGLL